jgi:spermidine synthase
MTIDISEQAGVRSLHFGTPWIQGSMRIARPWSLELEYTQHMMWPLLHFDAHTWPEKVLMIGLGTGSMLKFLYRYRPHCDIKVIEIDPQVVTIAHHHFKVPEPDGRLHIEIGDGAASLEKDAERYDLILVDGFDLNAKAHHLESESFYQSCRGHLLPDGMISCNLLTLHRSHASTKRALNNVFGDGLKLLPLCEDGNRVAIAPISDDVRINFETQRAAAYQLKKTTHLNLLPLISALEKQGL